MKFQKMIFSAILMAVASFFLIACGAGSTTENTNTETVETATPAPEAPSETTVSQDGPEYTSAYICPMHCAGSGSAEAGNCPVCGMDYVMNEKLQGDDHSGHDHDSHEGHNH